MLFRSLLVPARHKATVSTILKQAQSSRRGAWKEEQPSEILKHQIIRFASAWCEGRVPDRNTSRSEIATSPDSLVETGGSALKHQWHMMTGQVA